MPPLALTGNAWIGGKMSAEIQRGIDETRAEERRKAYVERELPTIECDDGWELPWQYDHRADV